MKIGKVPENVLKRSVLRQIHKRRSEVTNGAGVGEDCAVFSFGSESVVTCMQTAVISGAAAIPIGHLIQRCANNLAAAGARPVGVMIGLMFPEETEESDIKASMEEAEAKCRELDIQILGGQTDISRAVKQQTAAVTGYGRPIAVGAVAARGRRPEAKRAYAGLDVVISKWVGLEGTAILARCCREQLCQRYPAYFVEEAAGFDRFLSVIPEAATAMKSGVCMMHDASQGGIFGALWELAEKAGVGLKIDLKKIPLRQETVEVCEYCNVNPYELLSGGALVMLAADGPGLAAALEAEGISAVVAGRTAEGNTKIVVNGDETRFLDRPKNDEVYRWLTEEQPEYLNQI